ncbi:MAG: methionyl-tRNA formyltransferase [Rickettsiales bacterium]|jgi:methionyl-tRNA formyltransferase|nr:methionyl-tRNA formyltransferase [Rickettsiales bacterium]
MRIVLMGTPEFVVPVFDNLSRNHEVVATFTRAPKPQGRKKIITKSPVDAWAESKNIPTHYKISELNNYTDIDFVIVMAYGVIIPDSLLEKYKFINIHPSDLPAYRGAAPITTAIYNGDTESAVCLMSVASDVDSGDVFMREKFAIGENDTTADIEKKVGEIAIKMLEKFLASPEKFPPVAQVGTPSFSRKWTGADEIIDWGKKPEQIHNQIRSIGGRTKINGIDTKILQTKVINGELEILRVQPAGKNAMTWKDFLNGQTDKSPSLAKGWRAQSDGVVVKNDTI